MSEIKDWSTTAANNNAVPPDGFPEQQAPSTVNNSAREVMASVRLHYDDQEWRDWGHTITYASATSFTTSAGDGDTTGVYHANRRIEVSGTTTGTIYGSISSSSHTTQTTVNVTWDSGSLNNEALTVRVGYAADTQSIAQGSINEAFPAGTKQVFYNASAPTGWTTDTGVTDRMLYITTSSPGTTGGTNSPISYTPSGSNVAESSHTHASGTYTVASHSHGDGTLVVSSHTHPAGTLAAPRDPGNDSGAAVGATQFSLNQHNHSITGSTGGATAGITGSTGSASPDVTGVSSSTSHNHGWNAGNSFTPKYARAIIATKD